MRVHVVDPSAYTPPYDHALSAALARAGAEVELHTSEFLYGPVPVGAGYEVRRDFYRWAPGGAGSRARFVGKLVTHVPDMLRYRRTARAADVVHFQWLTVQPLDVHLLPRSRPVVLTAHDVLPREPRPGQLKAQRRLYERVDAVIVHSEHGRRRLVEEAGVPEGKLHVIPHGVFDYLTRQPAETPLPDDLAAVEGPVVLFFGLLRPYKGIDVLLEAWRGIEGAELWIVGNAADGRRAAARGGAAGRALRPALRHATPRSRRSSGAPTSPCCRTARSTSPACSSPRWPSGRRCCSPTWAASRRWRPPARPSSWRPATPTRCARRCAGCSPIRRGASACAPPPWAPRRTRTPGTRSRAARSPSTKPSQNPAP